MSEKNQLDRLDEPRRSPCLRHNSTHSPNECDRVLREAQEAFEATGAIEGRSSARFASICFSEEGKKLHFEYRGFYCEDDGSYTYWWNDTKAQRSYAINCKDWDGTLEGLQKRMRESDLEWAAITRKHGGGLL